MAGETAQAGRACEFCGRREASPAIIHGADGDHVLCAEDKDKLDGVVAAVERWLDWPDTVTRARALDLLRTCLEPTGIDVADRPRP